MVHRLRGQEQFLGNGGIAQSFRQQLQDLRLAFRETVRIKPRQSTRSSRNTLYTARTHLLAQSLGSRCRTQLLVNGQRLPLFRFPPIPTQQVGPLVGTAELLPGSSGFLPPARHLQRKRRSDSVRRRVEGSGSPQPDPQCTFGAQIGLIPTQLVNRADLANDTVLVFHQPRTFRKSCRERPETLRLAAFRGQRP